MRRKEKSFQLETERAEQQKRDALCSIEYGGVAQLGEHLLCKQGVIGSNPFISTSGEEVENLGTRIWAYSSAG